MQPAAAAPVPPCHCVAVVPAINAARVMPLYAAYAALTEPQCRQLVAAHKCQLDSSDGATSMHYSSNFQRSRSTLVS